MTAKTPEQLVSVYGDMVYRLAYAQTRSRHDADDIFQEVFLQTVRKRPVFDSVEHEKAWLLRVTLNCLKSHWRMAWRRHDTPLDDRIPFPEPEDSALDEALRRADAQVPRGSAFILLRGLHRREIARMSGEKPSAIRTRLTRARIQLRELMKGELDDEFSQAVPRHE